MTQLVLHTELGKVGDIAAKVCVSAGQFAVDIEGGRMGGQVGHYRIAVPLLRLVTRHIFSVQGYVSVFGKLYDICKFGFAAACRHIFCNNCVGRIGVFGPDGDICYKYAVISVVGNRVDDRKMAESAGYVIRSNAVAEKFQSLAAAPGSVAYHLKPGAVCRFRRRKPAGRIDGHVLVQLAGIGGRVTLGGPSVKGIVHF